MDLWLIFVAKINHEETFASSVERDEKWDNPISQGQQ
jgi:hypothetical protein